MAGQCNGLEHGSVDKETTFTDAQAELGVGQEISIDSEEDAGENDNFITEVETESTENGEPETDTKRFSLKCFHLRKDLLKFKLFYLSFGGAIGAFFPYWSVYLKQLGLSPKQIGLLSGIRPLVGFWTGPLWGSVADRFRIRKIILGISAIGWLVSLTSIGLVPAAEHTNDQCNYVRDFLNISQLSINKTLKTTLNEHPTVHTTSRDEFNELHGDIPGVSPMENILESRGWMYERKGIDKVFYIILTLTLLGELVMSPTGALGDAMCLEHLGNNRDAYGYNRAFGSMGIGLLSLFVGSLISTTRHDVTICDVTVTTSNYSSVYYTFAACMIVCFICTLFYGSSTPGQSDKKREKPNPFKVFKMFLTAHYASWLFCMLFTGVCNGVIWGFLFWHLENIGATQFLLGVANGISLFFEMVMFLVVFKILNRVGSITFMCIGLLGYSVRFAVFATMKNPWLVLPFEILQGATFAGVWSAFIKYMCANVPADYSGTLQGFLHSMYWGVGAGSGQLIGGAIIERLGARVTFWIFSGLSLVNLIFFVIVQKCSTKPDVFSDYSKLDESDALELDGDVRQANDEAVTEHEVFRDASETLELDKDQTSATDTFGAGPDQFRDLSKLDDRELLDLDLK